MIAAIVPAAGLSRRMGLPKLILPLINGGTLLGTVVKSLREGGIDRVIVVTPPSECPITARLERISREMGAIVLIPGCQPADMRASIEYGLGSLLHSHREPRLVLICPADSPGITCGLVAKVLQTALANPGAIVIPTFEGKRGHPVILPWRIARRIADLPEGAGVNALMKENATAIVDVPVAERGAIVDLDTPEDYAKWNSMSPALMPSLHSFEQDHGNNLTIRLSKGSRSIVRVTVRLFAIARQRAGLTEVTIDLEGEANVGELRKALGDRYPELLPILPSLLIAVDNEYATDDMTIPSGSEVAAIPPVSGGRFFFQATDRDE